MTSAVDAGCDCPAACPKLHDSAVRKHEDGNQKLITERSSIVVPSKYISKKCN